MEEVLGAETIRSLIQNGGFMRPTPNGTVEIYELDGIPLTKHFMEPSTLEALKTWQARQDDVFVVSYPKAGTTWTQEIVSAIINEGNLEELNKSHTIFRIPFLEATFFRSTKEIKVQPTHEVVDKMKSPRTIKSHLPGHLLPPDVMKKKGRIVYVARNPKDLVVSYYYFSIGHSTLPQLTWDDFFQDFCAGKTVYGPWWNHYLYYWKLRHEPNVLFLKFEDMKKDLRAIVKKMADFLCYSFSDDIIDSIVSHCTFANMKANPMTNPDTVKFMMKNMNDAQKNNNNQNDRPSFMRKGKVGDWKSRLTVAQNEAIDALIREKLTGSGLVFEF